MRYSTALVCASLVAVAAALPAPTDAQGRPVQVSTSSAEKFKTALMFILPILGSITTSALSYFVYTRYGDRIKARYERVRARDDEGRLIIAQEMKGWKMPEVQIPNMPSTTELRDTIASKVPTKLPTKEEIQAQIQQVEKQLGAPSTWGQTLRTKFFALRNKTKDVERDLAKQAVVGADKLKKTVDEDESEESEDEDEEEVSVVKQPLLNKDAAAPKWADASKAADLKTAPAAYDPLAEDRRAGTKAAVTRKK